MSNSPETSVSGKVAYKNTKNLHCSWQPKSRVHYRDYHKQLLTKGADFADGKILVKSKTNPSLSKFYAFFDSPSNSNTVIRWPRNLCEECGINNIPIMTHLPMLSLPQSQTAIDLTEERQDQAMLPLALTVARPQFLQVSRRPSVLLQDILTRVKGHEVNGRPPVKSLKNQGSNEGTAVGSSVTINTNKDDCKNASMQQQKYKNRRHGNDALSAALSAVYCKFIVLVGVCLPITVVISDRINTYLYQSFYVYLYSVSVLYVLFLYLAQCRNRTLFNALKENYEKTENLQLKYKITHFGSFYLRVGAIAFAIGTMVYSGLEFGQFFELHNQPDCKSLFVAITPLLRMLLCIAQIQFIFLNTTYLDLAHHKVISRFGLMHMIATNLCEWLYVLVEETKHEIFHLKHDGLYYTEPVPVPRLQTLANMSVNITAYQSESTPGCTRTTIMGSLVQKVAPFLFPCTIEYSLICAVMLFEMWKTIKSIPDINKTRKHSVKPIIQKPAHHFSVDCSQSHKGLFFGILVVVMTIISMIMYFVLYTQPGYEFIATQEITVWETIMYLLTGVAVCTGLYKMRDLKYVARTTHDMHSMALDNMLLVVAQTGVYVYGLFSIMGSYFSNWDSVPDRAEGITAETFGLIQTSLQTMFVLHASHRRCKGAKHIRKKPGRELITFLLIANISIWFMNTLIKGRAVFRGTHLIFYGVWGWTIITHISMPLAIFYRFHSTICLFEIWKVSYKAKSL